jgi:hypothetical protein
MTYYVNKYNYVLTNVNKTNVLLVMDKFINLPIRLRYGDFPFARMRGYVYHQLAMFHVKHYLLFGVSSFFMR